ncbi:hypothetical protein [Nocardioides limicola]|nr:hypothetical protein [Nocardioides sp. DJM-14]
MSSVLATIAPIVAFMLIPVWIPLGVMACGAVYDVVRPSRA